jgi:hypothetical protein
MSGCRRCERFNANKAEQQNFAWESGMFFVSSQKPKGNSMKIKLCYLFIVLAVSPAQAGNLLVNQV